MNGLYDSDDIVAAYERSQGIHRNPTMAAPAKAGPVTPTLGRIVHYRGKQGRQCWRAAIVTCTRADIAGDAVEQGELPALDSDTHLHLHVLTPSDRGFFVEYNVPQGEDPGCWRWPPRT